MKNWTKSDIDKLLAAGKIRAYKDNTLPVQKAANSGRKSQKALESSPLAVQYIENLLLSAGIEYVKEHRFHATRKFRFDIAIPSKMIAIEYEGLVATGKKGGHQTKTGYTSNCTKYNLAASMGWKVYRYTAKNYKEFNLNLIK